MSLIIPPLGSVCASVVHLHTPAWHGIRKLLSVWGSPAVMASPSFPFQGHKGATKTAGRT